MKIKRKLAGILSVLMVFSCVMGGTYWRVNASDVKYAVNFGSGTWTVAGTTVTASMEVVSGGDAVVSGGNVSGGNVSGGNVSIISQNVSGVRTISEKDVITLKGFNAENMEVRLTGDNGFSTTLSVAGGQTSLSARNDEALPEGTLNFAVVEKTPDDGDDGSEDDGDDGNGGSGDDGDDGNGGSEGGGDDGNGGSEGDGDGGNDGSEAGGDDGDDGSEDSGDDGGSEDGEGDGSENFADITKPEDNACGADLNESSNGLIDKILTIPEKERLEEGEDVNVYLDVKDITSNVSSADKSLIDDKKGSASVGMYLDIDLMKQIGSDEPVNVTETNGTIKITLNIPSSLINTNSNIDRAYQVLRIHNGVAELLSSIYDAVLGTISFETDQFSTYAIVYADYPKYGDGGNNTNSGNTGSTGSTSSNNSTAAVNANELDEVPSTGDDSLYIPWQIIALMGVVAVLVFTSRKLVYKKKN